MERSLREVIGGNLRAARENMGLSQETFAEKLELSRATLSAIENGHSEISSTNLLKASQILGPPVTDFFSEKQENVALLYPAAEHGIPNPEVCSRFRRFCEAYRELEEIVGVADTLLSPPEYSYSPEFHSKPLQFAAQVAYSERERLDLGQIDPIENIFKLLDDSGVRIFPYRVEQEGVFGISAFSRGYGPCIMVNTVNSIERQIFTAAHEYGHLLMHRAFYTSADLSNAAERDHEMEEMAHIFAANFLVPEIGLRDAFGKNVARRNIDLEDIVFLKRHFRVSAQVMARRLFDLGLITQSEQRQVLESASKAQPGAKKEYAPLGADLVGEWQSDSRFMHLARKAVLSGMISLGKLAELLNQNLLEVRSLVKEWRKEFVLAPA